LTRQAEPGRRGEDVQDPADLAFDQVLAEPISISFDERARLWVVQYSQYPHAVGLTVLGRDIFWRVVPPPPHHFRGKPAVGSEGDRAHACPVCP
jgi:hypothetical protein